MAGFLIQYNRRTRASYITEYLEADGHRQAMRRRLELEREPRDADVEIVALASDSLETVRRTHSRYFAGELVHC